MQHSLEKAAIGIGIYVEEDKTKAMSMNKMKQSSHQMVNLSSNIPSTESHVIIRIGKMWIAIDRLAIIQKSDLSNKIRRKFFQSVAELVLLYIITTE